MISLSTSNSKFVKVLQLYINNEDGKDFILVFRRKLKEDLIITKENIFQCEQTFKNDVYFKFNHKVSKQNVCGSSRNSKIYNDIVRPYVEKIGRIKFIDNMLFIFPLEKP